MPRAFSFGLLPLVFFATTATASVWSCSDQTVAVPTVPPGSTDAGAKDGTAPVTGWGDPASTKRPGVLRIQQLNTRRYFDATCDSNDCAAGGFEEVVSADAFSARTAEIAQALSRIEADVITLGEVENQAALDALQKQLKASGQEYPVAFLAEIGSAGSVDVGVLSRGKLDSTVPHRKDPLPNGMKFTREFPEVHLTIGTATVIVFAAHFRSKADDEPARRLAEATAAHTIMVDVAAANTGALVLLGGDLNDTPGSPPLNALEKDNALVRVAKDLPTDQQGTYNFGGSNQAIDHIYTTASHASSYVPKSAKVVRDGSGTTGGFGGSDHASIYADFNLP